MLEWQAHDGIGAAVIFGPVMMAGVLALEWPPAPEQVYIAAVYSCLCLMVSLQAGFQRVKNGPDEPRVR